MPTNVVVDNQIMTRIERGATQGMNCYNAAGAPIRAVVFPGEGMMSGSISFEGSLNGIDWFPVRSTDGTLFSLRVPLANPQVAGRRAPNPVPIGNSRILAFPFLRPVASEPEAATVEIIFLLEGR